MTFTIASLVMVAMHDERSYIKQVENGLRYGVLIQGEKNPHKTLAERMVFHNISTVSIAVIDQGKVAWAKAYNNDAYGVQSGPIDTHTLFQAASISKPFTAMGILLLVQQGKVSLDEDVNTYLTSWKVPENECTKTEKVTLRKLLSHTAGTSVHGFAGYDIDEKIPSVVEILYGVKPITNSDPVCVTQVPGCERRYSGGGTTIVQLLVEDVTGEDFAEWMKKNILIPFGMHASSFNQPLSVQESQHAACGYYDDGKPVHGKWHIYPEKGAAGLWTTPTDLAQFAITFNNILHGKQEGPLQQAFAQLAITKQFGTDNNGPGLGFFLTTDENGSVKKYNHGGCNEGFESNFVVYPHLSKGWVIMVNKNGVGGFIDEIENSIADVYSIPDKQPVVKSVINVDEAIMHSYVGIYKDINDSEHTIIITIKDDKLYCTDSWMRLKELQLYCEENNSFFVKEQHSVSIQFSSEQNDTITLISDTGDTFCTFKKS